MVHIPRLAFDTLTISHLSLKERGELERAVDGPITPAMIADKVRARDSVRGAESESAQILTARIRWARADIAFYERQIADLETERALLVVDHEKMYGMEESGRKARHVAALNTQQHNLRIQCEPYYATLHDALRKLAKLYGATNE
jgi:hypothetical protein